MKRTWQRPITKLLILQPSVFFDGVCGLCNATVDLLLRADRHHRLLFASLQGETAHARLGLPADAPLDTLVLLDAQGRHDRSSAVLRIAYYLGGPWHALAVFWLVPRPVRDAVYQFIARHRYVWFGKRATCRLASPAERGRFLP